jgi:hypothetical protein
VVVHIEKATEICLDDLEAVGVMCSPEELLLIPDLHSPKRDGDESM